MGLSLGTVLGAAGAIVGGIYGGPQGAAAGYSIGSGVGGAIEGDEAQRDAERKAAKSRAEYMEHQKGIYKDWQEVYGSVEKNLSEFYQNLTPESLTTMGLQKVEQEFTKQQTDIQRSFGQRNIDSPAALVQILNQSEIAEAEARAGVRATAPFKVAEAKQAFVATGKGEKVAAQQGVAGAINQNTNFYMGEAEAYRQQTQQALSNIGEGIGMAAGADWSTSGTGSGETATLNRPTSRNPRTEWT